MSKTTRTALLGFIGVTLSFLTLCIYHLDFPLGIHKDEIKKVKFIKNGEQDFKHPILMLQSIRLLLVDEANMDSQTVAFRGRMVTVLVALIAIAVFYFLFYKLYGAMAIPLVGIMALSPLITMHSHYIKEDIYLFFGISIFLLGEFKRETSKPLYGILITGLGLGLSFSAHYKSLLLVVVLGIVWLLIKRSEKKKYFFHILMSTVIGCGIFLLINFPIFSDLETFKSGFEFERNHALEGHTIKVWPTSQFFSFHLRKSLFVGFGVLPTILGILGLLISLAYYRRMRHVERVILVSGFIFYLVVEISPLKPFPGYIRYVIPVLPALALGIRHVGVIFKRFLPNKPAVFGTLLWACAVFEMVSSYRFVDQIGRDSRLEADKVTLADDSYFFEVYTTLGSPKQYIFSMSDMSPKDFSKRFSQKLVLSSFIYERYLLGGEMPNQNERIYFAAYVYKELLSHAIATYSAPVKSFGFHSPTVVIVDPSGINPEQLWKEAKAYAASRVK